MEVLRSEGHDVVPADEVAAAVAHAAAGDPINGIVSIGGPMTISFEQMARDALAPKGDESKTVQSTGVPATSGRS